MWCKRAPSWVCNTTTKHNILYLNTLAEQATGQLQLIILIWVIKFYFSQSIVYCFIPQTILFLLLRTPSIGAILRIKKNSHCFWKILMTFQVIWISNSFIIEFYFLILKKIILYIPEDILGLPELQNTLLRYRHMHMWKSFSNTLTDMQIFLDLYKSNLKIKKCVFINLKCASKCIKSDVLFCSYYFAFFLLYCVYLFK